MVLLLNENTGMNGGSGDVECEGMSVDGDGSEGMGIDVDVEGEHSKLVFGDECKDGTGIGNTRCNSTDVLLKRWVSSSKLIH
jgi:hypothetical protein